MTAGEIEFQGSAWTLLTGLPDMLTFHFFGGSQPFNEVTVRHGELHLERSLTDNLNWTEFIAAVPQSRIADAEQGVYQVHGLVLDDFRISYIEHIPGGSGDGIIRTAGAQVKIDELHGQIVDLMQPEQTGQRPTRFSLKGRTADGVFEISGNVALFPPANGAAKPASSDLRTVSLRSDASTASNYPFEISIYLENIAAGAYGKMVPVTTIVPVNGVIAGTTKVTSSGTRPVCEGSFTMKDVIDADSGFDTLLAENLPKWVIKRTTVVKVSFPDGPVGPNSAPHAPLSHHCQAYEDQTGKAMDPSLIKAEAPV